MGSQIRSIRHASLTNLNTFGVSVTAELLVEIPERAHAADCLSEVIKNCPSPLLVLGDGSNVLFTQDFDGTVIRFLGNQIQVDCDNDAAPVLRADAGANWHRLVLTAAKERLWGIENLALIPGSCGAAPIQNIGAYGMELADTLVSVEAVSLHDACPVTFSREQCELGYRTSRFRDSEPDTFLITQIALAVSRTAQPVLSYPGVVEAWGDASPTPLSIAHAVSRLRQSKLPDPGVTGNAGSFFKNPLVTTDQLKELRDEFEDLPAYTNSAGTAKLSAAWLIEAAGWKGHRVDSIGVSPRHALVLVNYGGGTGQAILDLARRVRASVREQFGVSLEPEPRIL